MTADIVQVVEAIEPKITENLPRGTNLTAAVFRTAVLNCLRANRKLLDCTPATVRASILQCAQLGLFPGNLGGLAQAYLVPYGAECQLVIGYQGLIELALRSGHVIDLHAEIVRERDVFDYDLGARPNVIHKPALAERGDIVAAYAVAILANNIVRVEVMDRTELDRIRNLSRGKNSPAWTQHASEMYRKCPTRRIAKQLPRSIWPHQARELLDREDERFGLERTIEGATANRLAELRERLDSARPAEGSGEAKDEPTDAEPETDDLEEPGGLLFRGDNKGGL